VAAKHAPGAKPGERIQDDRLELYFLFQRSCRARRRLRGQRCAHRSVPGRKRSLLSTILGTSFPDSLASLLIGLLLALTAFGLARPFADFLIGRSIAQPLFEQLYAIVKEDAAIEQILSLRAMYSGPEEVVVMAKVHPSAHMNIEQLTRAMDDLDHRIRVAMPLVAGVFVDVTASRAQEDPRTRVVNE